MLKQKKFGQKNFVSKFKKFAKNVELSSVLFLASAALFTSSFFVNNNKEDIYETDINCVTMINTKGQKDEICVTTGMLYGNYVIFVWKENEIISVLHNNTNLIVQ
jgi:hypothetical protein